MGKSALAHDLIAVPAQVPKNTDVNSLIINLIAFCLRIKLISQ